MSQQVLSGYKNMQNRENKQCYRRLLTLFNILIIRLLFVIVCWRFSSFFSPYFPKKNVSFPNGVSLKPYMVPADCASPFIFLKWILRKQVSG